MKNRVNKIEILNERDFDRLIEEHDVERFSCSGDRCNETGNILRIAIYANYNIFDELEKQLNDSEYGFRLYGGVKSKKTKFVLFEIFKKKGFML